MLRCHISYLHRYYVGHGHGHGHGNGHSHGHGRGRNISFWACRGTRSLCVERGRRSESSVALVEFLINHTKV